METNLAKAIAGQTWESLEGQDWTVVLVHDYTSTQIIDFERIRSNGKRVILKKTVSSHAVGWHLVQRQSDALEL